MDAYTTTGEHYNRNALMEFTHSILPLSKEILVHISIFHASANQTHFYTKNIMFDFFAY